VQEAGGRRLEAAKYFRFFSDDSSVRSIDIPDCRHLERIESEERT